MLLSSSSTIPRESQIEQKTWLAVIEKITIQVQGISSNLFICFAGLLKKEELIFQVCLSEVISKEYFLVAYKYLKSNQNADSAIIYALKVCYDYEKIKHELTKTYYKPVHSKTGK